MIGEVSIYTLKSLSDEERATYGLRVLTMRKWPRNVRRSDIDHRAGRIDWAMFLARYQDEQEQQEITELVTYHGSERIGCKTV